MAVLFAAFAVVELWTPIAHGGWFIPADDGQGWPITRVADLPASPHNGLTGDVYEGLGPFLHYDLSQVRAGQLPTWNPLDGNGGPYLANGQSAVLSPYTGLYYLFGMRLGLLAAALAKLWLLGFFTYLFLVRHRLHEVAAVVGGALFAYAGFHLVWLDYQVAVAVSATLPVALWCGRVALDQRDGGSGRRRRRLALAGLAAAVGVMGVAGHTEAFLFDTLLVAAYLLVALVVEHRAWRTRLAWAGRVAAAGALGVALALAQLLPLWQYQRDSSRVALIHSSASRVSPGFPVDTVPLAAFANLFGGPQLPYYDRALYGVHEQTNYAEVSGTAVGLVGVCLVPVGMVALGSSLVTRRRRRREHSAVVDADRSPPSVPFLGWFALGAMVVDGLLLYSRAAGTLWWHLPGVGVAVLNRSQDIVLFGAAVLGAVGLDWMLRAPSGARLGRLAWGLGAYVVAAAALVAGALSLRASLGVAGAPTHGVVGGNLAGQLVLAGLVAAGLVLLVADRARWLQVVVGLGLAGVAFASNGLVMRSYNTTVAGRHVYPVTPALASVESRVGTGAALFAGGSSPWADVNLWYGLRDVGSFDPLDLAWHDALYRRVFATADHGGTEQMPRCRNGLALFDVQWVVGGDGRFLQSGQVPLKASTTVMDGISLYRAPGSSFASVVGRSAEAPGDGSALEQVASCAFDPGSTVVLDSPSYRSHDTTPLGPVRGSDLPGTARVSVVRRVANGALTLRVDSPGPAWVVLHQTWAPGWSAAVDGRPAILRRADVAFDAVRVPPGRHLVVLAYDAPGLRTGVIVSLTALAGVLAMVMSGVLAGARRARRGAHVRRRSSSS